MTRITQIFVCAFIPKKFVEIEMWNLLFNSDNFLCVHRHDLVHKRLDR